MMATENKTCKECADFERCKIWNYSYDPCPWFKDGERLICLDAVIKKLKDELKTYKPAETSDNYITKFKEKVIPRLLNNVIDYLEAQPTVDAVEVVHGNWINDDEYDICSNCNNPIIMNRLHPDRWCKNCGAKMDGGN